MVKTERLLSPCYCEACGALTEEHFEPVYFDKENGKQVFVVANVCPHYKPLLGMLLPFLHRHTMEYRGGYVWSGGDSMFLYRYYYANGQEL